MTIPVNLQSQDPFCPVLDQLWRILDANADFTDRVKANNRIKFGTAGYNASKLNPLKSDIAQPGELPEVEIRIGTDTHQWDTGSGEVQIDQNFVITVLTGDMRLSFYDPDLALTTGALSLEWIIAKALLAAGETLGITYVTRARVTTALKLEESRGHEGWSVLITVTVRMTINRSLDVVTSTAEVVTPPAGTTPTPPAPDPPTPFTADNLVLWGNGTGTVLKDGPALADIPVMTAGVLPAVDGSLLTNLPVQIPTDGSQLTNVPDSALSANVPVMTAGVLPIADGSLLTNLPVQVPTDGSQLTNVPDSALSGNVPVMTGGALPAVDGSALTGVQAKATSPNGAVCAIKFTEELVSLSNNTIKDSTGDLLPENSYILGVVAIVQTALSPQYNWKMGTTGDDDKFAQAGQDYLAGTRTSTLSSAFAGPGAQMLPYLNPTAGKVRITAATATTGKIRVTVFYLDLTPPTS